MQASFTFTGTPETYIASRGQMCQSYSLIPQRCTHGLRCFNRASGLVTYAVKAK